MWVEGRGAWWCGMAFRNLKVPEHSKLNPFFRWKFVLNDWSYSCIMSKRGNNSHSAETGDSPDSRCVKYCALTFSTFALVMSNFILPLTLVKLTNWCSWSSNGITVVLPSYSTLEAFSSVWCSLSCLLMFGLCFPSFQADTGLRLFHYRISNNTAETWHFLQVGRSFTMNITSVCCLSYINVATKCRWSSWNMWSWSLQVKQSY